MTRRGGDSDARALSRSVGAMRSGYPDKAFVSVPSFGDVRGVPSYEPALQVTLKVVTAGLPDGASALFLVTGQVQAASGRMADLGIAEPVFEQLSYGPDQPREFDFQVRWRLSSAGVERLEQLRAGGGFTMSVGVRYGLLGGTGAPDWREPHRPVRVPYPDQPVQVIIKAHDWVQNVLEPMQQAAAVSLVVALPQGRTTDDHRTIVARLADAKRELDAQVTGSRASPRHAKRASCSARCARPRSTPSLSSESCQSARRSSSPNSASSPRCYSITTRPLVTRTSVCATSPGTGRMRSSRSGRRRASRSLSSPFRDDSGDRPARLPQWL